MVDLDQHDPGRAQSFHNKRKIALMVSGIVAGGLVVNLALGALLIPRASVALQSISDRVSSDGLVPGEQVYDNTDFSHTEADVDYPQTPSTGGPHAPVWLNCGVYDSEVPEENATHSMEHGAVWVTYDPSLDSAQVQQLRDTFGYDPYVIVSPYAGQDYPVMASAWNHQVGVESADESSLMQFVQTYAQGPQTPEPGAPCYGGIGPEDLAF